MLYVNSYLPSIGGRELVVHQLAKSYQELGHKVRVVGPGCWWKHRKAKFQYPLHRWPRIPLVTKDFAWSLQLFFAVILYRPDVIHAHSTYPTGYIAARLKKLLKFPLIITPHGEDIHVIPEINFGQRLDPVQNKKIHYALEVAGYITAISDSVAKSISTTNVPEEKIIPIPNGVDLNRFQQNQSFDIYDYLGFSHESQLVVTIGNYHPRKGHEILIESIKEAIKKNQNIRLAIVGRTSDKIINKVRNEGLEPYIKFTGPLTVPVNEMEEVDILAALLNEAKIYVSSSIDEGAEGMSLALLEAMSAGACLIVTDISGNRDIVKDGVSGLTVPPSSSHDMANSIVHILENEKLRVQFISQSMEIAKRYGWLEIANKYIELYRVAIDKNV
jgi:glycosyltransferase involved in cell wall biosynthesis